MLIFFAFISGIFTFLAPCIWPILPIIFSSSLKNKFRPFGIVAGVSVSFFVLTLGASSVLRLITFDAQCRCLIAAFVIGTLGILMLVPNILGKLETKLSELTNALGVKPPQDAKGDFGGGFWGGFLTGLVLGVVWAPCAGPILGTTIALSYAGEHSWQTLLISISYVLGLAIPLSIFAYAGNKIMDKSRNINKYTEKIQQVFGVMLILFAVAVCTGKDKDISTRILDAVPGYSEIIRKIENNIWVNKEIEKLKLKSIKKRD